MEPAISFCSNRTGARLAYATLGQGPVLVVPPGWVSHLQLQLEHPILRAYPEALARRFTVVLYDKEGTGLSTRDRTDFRLEKELEDLEAVIEQLPDGPLSLLGASQGGPIAIAYAVRHPERVRRLALYGTYARGERIAPPELRSSLLSLVRASWGLGSRTLADVFIPESVASVDAVELFTRFQREASSADMAARLLQSVYEFDVEPLLGELREPTLVVHRRDDKTIPARLGIDLAGRIPSARLVLLAGSVHLPWLGDTEQLVRVISEFLEADPGAESAAPTASETRGTHPRPEASETGRAAEAAAPAPGPGRHYEIVHRDLLGDPAQAPHCRVGLAQVGTSEVRFEPQDDGMFVLPRRRLAAVLTRTHDMLERARRSRVDLLVFPEMTLDLNHRELVDLLDDFARANAMYVVAGGYHDLERRVNLSRVFGPEGVAWEQEKHIPAVVKLAGQRVVERIHTRRPGVITVANTRVGRVAITICRDFLDLDLRVALKNTTPEPDIVLNPAFTPVTADFEAAHFEARRSMYAVTCFCNFAEFGGSLLQSPEKRRRRSSLPPAREGLIFRDFDLLGVRAARKRWEAFDERRFIQSTR